VGIGTRVRGAFGRLLRCPIERNVHVRFSGLRYVFVQRRCLLPKWHSGPHKAELSGHLVRWEDEEDRRFDEPDVDLSDEEVQVGDIQ
jgi:hypothetical protein